MSLIYSAYSTAEFWKINKLYQSLRSMKNCRKLTTLALLGDNADDLQIERRKPNGLVHHERNMHLRIEGNLFILET